jgi:DNA-binding NarL/FixJ family response regulator
MEKLATQHHEDLAKNGEVIRVLLYSDSPKAELIRLYEHHKPVCIIGRVNTTDELITKAADLQPDAIVMLAYNNIPTKEFSNTIMRLQEAQLTGRVVLMGNPAVYLCLAIKARAAVLLPISASYCETVSAICEVRASFKDTIQKEKTAFHIYNPGLYPNQEVTTM